MKPNLLCIETQYGKLPKIFKVANKRGDATLIRQTELTQGHLQKATGLITTMHLDQLSMMDFSDDLEAFLMRGGRWFFNGHMMRPLVFELKTYEHVGKMGKTALELTELADHCIFNGIDRTDFGARKGVSGFYGRGSNPLPKGATAITGVGDKQAPLDWEWKITGGGRVFSHAGNDLQGTAGSKKMTTRLCKNIISWALAES